MRLPPLCGLILVANAAVAAGITPATEGPFRVEGARILDSRGHPFLIRGTALPAFRLETAAVLNRSGRDFGPYSATSLAAVRLLFNMNAVRLPLDVRDAARPGYFAALQGLVRRAHELELLVILAAREPGAGLPSQATRTFWSRCAAAFADDPNVMFDVFSDPSGAGIDAHGPTGWETWRRAMSGAVESIRAAGARQPVLVMAWTDGRLFEGAGENILLDDPAVIYEVSGNYAAARDDAERESRFGFLAARVPVALNGWDLELDNAQACASIPTDASAASDMVRRHLEYLDRRSISWTISTFEPGKLVKDLILHAATSLEDGFACGPQKRPAPGLGRLVEGHLRGTGERSLFVVSDSGGIDLPRGAFAIGYGPVMAERDTRASGPRLPLKLGGVAVEITDAAGVTRPSRMIWTSAGWGQVNFVIPDETAPGDAVLRLVRDDGSCSETRIHIADTAPGLRSGLSLRGPALGTLAATGQPIWQCLGVECRALPIPVPREGAVAVRLMATGLRHAASAQEIRVTAGGRDVPVLSYGPGDEPGMDQLTIAIPSSLRGAGETDLMAHVRGRVSNVVRILLADAGGVQPFAWQLPKGFPVPRVPADNPMSEAKVRLGRYLFYDTRLSGNGTQSCATCHRQELAFTDGRATSLGSTGQSHPRSAMSLVNVAYSAAFTWSNPGPHSLEQQAVVPMLGDHPVELGLRGREAATLAVLRQDPVYQGLFPDAFPGASGGAFTMANVARALAAFERTIISARSPYDRFHVGGETGAISEAAQRGETVFFSDPVAGCFRCHSGINLTDGQHHNTALYDPYPAANLGLIQFTGRPADAGKFKTPSLRNVAVTGPYMHDGSIATLEEVLDHYAQGGRAHQNPRRDPLLHRFVLTPQNRADLLEFLRSLTDEELLHDASFSNPW